VTPEGKIMKRAFTLFILGVSLAGCVTAEERAMRLDALDNQSCENMGYTRGTQLYLQCRQLQASNRLAAQQANAQAMAQTGQALQNMGQAMQARDAMLPPPPVIQPVQPVHTTCVNNVGVLNCNTY